MPYVHNSGVRIHYHLEGKGPPLVLQHGFTHDMDDWREAGFVDALKGDYQLVLIDARGHGHSDKPHDPQSYALDLRVSDVVAVLDELNISKAHYFGYSMGGAIGYGVVKCAAERLYSLIIGGMHPYEHSGESNRERFSKGIDAAYADSTFPRERLSRRMRNDAEALVAASLDLDSMADEVLPKMTMPCLVYVGEADPIFAKVQKAAKHMPSATYFSIPGVDHLGAFYQSGLVLPHVKRFLAEVDPPLGLVRSC